MSCAADSIKSLIIYCVSSKAVGYKFINSNNTYDNC